MDWKVHGAWIDGYDSQNKDKNIIITKNKSVILSLQCIIAKPCDFPFVIGAILEVILSILQS